MNVSKSTQGFFKIFIVCLKGDKSDLLYGFFTHDRCRKNSKILPYHIEYLDQLDKEGKIFGRGPFSDGSEGLVIYIADSYKEAL